ncbi:hypothetical protein SO802_008010 [Lithocarpus litseifolius]|uniref:R13L1/DRL21-like LRR repeat region domain-containing protein n=1 Tax=Lithocarpus litseifolius TaxID=425828 RepID=A0AAW2DSY1_9ROSI
MLRKREKEERRRMENDVLVLNAIELPPQLECLKIWQYMGTTIYPNWMMSLTKLKRLVVSWCWKLKCLPPLEKLQFLESLYIWAASNVQKVGDEFLGIEEPESKNRNKKDFDYNIINIFPNLKSLKFEEMDNWEEWIGLGAMTEEEEKDNGFVPIKIMPRLHCLEIFLVKVVKDREESTSPRFHTSQTSRLMMSICKEAVNFEFDLEILSIFTFEGILIGGRCESFDKRMSPNFKAPFLCTIEMVFVE